VERGWRFTRLCRSDYVTRLCEPGTFVYTGLDLFSFVGTRIADERVCVERAHIYVFGPMWSNKNYAPSGPSQLNRPEPGCFPPGVEDNPGLGHACVQTLFNLRQHAFYPQAMPSATEELAGAGGGGLYSLCDVLSRETRNSREKSLNMPRWR
jgi:hypothetical protein